MAATPTHQTTAPQDKVPAGEKFALGLGQSASMGTHNALTTLSNPVYNVILGMNPAYLSVIVFVQRFWDAFLDPLVGHFSDNTASKWGRRRPYLLAAALPMAVTFAAIWFVRAGMSDFRLALFFTITSLVFYFFHSCYTVPLAALQIEVTGDYHERTRVASVVGICTWLFSIGNQWLFPIIQSGWFKDPITGIRWVTAGIAGLYALLACAPAFFVRERFQAPVKVKREKIRFLTALKQTAGNRDFALLIGVRSISTFGYSIVAVLGFYLNVYLVHGGDLRAAGAIQGWLGSAYVVGCIGSYWAFRVIALRVGKRRALQLAAGILVAAGIVKLFVYVPGLRWWQILVPAMNGIAQAGIMLLTTAMLADIVDADELKSGQRREGLYSSVLSWLDKVGSSTGGLISGFILVWVGFNAKLGSAQPEGTLALMKWLYAFFPFAGAAITIVLAQRYTLDENEAYEIKRRLEAQRAEQAGSN
ncbi:MFS transporter [Oleiharenicola lentus]|uniref:MFS transporter n=1 Tax=Oleiharenicola lentus TaxID=2508720 RepID=UPI003F674A79